MARRVTAITRGEPWHSVDKRRVTSSLEYLQYAPSDSLHSWIEGGEGLAVGTVPTNILDSLLHCKVCSIEFTSKTEYPSSVLSVSLKYESINCILFFFNIISIYCHHKHDLDADLVAYGRNLSHQFFGFLMHPSLITRDVTISKFHSTRSTLWYLLWH